MAARAYHKPDNVVLLDDRGVDTSQVRFPSNGCDQPKTLLDINSNAPSGNPYLMIALRFYAKRALKEHWKAQGIRVSYVLPRLTNQAAEQYLTEHWRELLPQAQRFVERVEQS